MPSNSMTGSMRLSLDSTRICTVMTQLTMLPSLHTAVVACSTCTDKQLRATEFYLGCLRFTSP